MQQWITLQNNRLKKNVGTIAPVFQQQDPTGGRKPNKQAPFTTGAGPGCTPVPTSSPNRCRIGRPCGRPARGQLLCRSNADQTFGLSVSPGRSGRLAASAMLAERMIKPVSASSKTIIRMASQR